MESEEKNQSVEYAEYLAGTRQLLEQSLQEKEPYRVTVLGKEFIVEPNVFSPKYFNDTEIFAEHLPVQQGEEILEIGPGTGVIAVMAKYKGAGKVTAVDINVHAVKNTRENAKLHHFEDDISVLYGDIYSPLKDDERFDVIFWNTPFGLVDENKSLSDLEKSVFDPGYKSTEEFIKGSRDHLKSSGRVIIGFSSTLGRLDLLQKFCDEADLDLHLLYEEQSEEVHPVKFEIFSATPRYEK